MLPNLEALWTPSFCVFMGASLHRCDWSNHWPLLIDSTSSPSPLPGNQGKHCNPVFVVGPPGNNAPTLRCFPKVTLLTQTRCGGKGLVGNNTDAHFTSMALQLFPQLSTREPLSWQKMLPLLLVLRQFHEFWTKSMWEIYFGHLNNQICISYKSQYSNKFISDHIQILDI